MVNRATAKATDIVSASGIEITDGAGHRMIDLVAAFASTLGHRDPGLVSAITKACGENLGSGFDTLSPDSLPSLGEPFDVFEAVSIAPSASEANERALRIARRAGHANDDPSSARFRIITLLASDHGDTLACRSASGRIEDQAGLLPLTPGFRHVAAGDSRALEKAIDPQTVAVMLAPVDWSRGGWPLDANYLRQVRKVCDDHSLLLIVDETRLPPAISGHWFFHQAADIQPDILTAAAGWTGGLPGGLVMVTGAALEAAIDVGPPPSDPLNHSDHDDQSGGDAPLNAKVSFHSATSMPIGETDYPVLRAVIAATAQGIIARGGPSQVADAAQRLDQAWQRFVEGFEFVSGCATQGLWAVTQFDLPASEVRRAAEKQNLRWIQSSDTTLLACLPMLESVIGDNSDASPESDFFQKLRLALETIERQTIES